MKPSFDRQLASAQQPVRVCSERREKGAVPSGPARSLDSFLRLQTYLSS